MLGGLLAMRLPQLNDGGIRERPFWKYGGALFPSFVRMWYE
jgi:hypothetical protein